MAIFMKVQIIFIISITTIIIYSCAPGGKIEKVPMRTYSFINIPDGEYLHYAGYKESKKSSDIYYLARKLTNENGEFIYRVYFEYITNGSKPPADYSQWHGICDFDPKTGSETESVVSCKSNERMNGWAAFGMKDIVFWHYKAFSAKGFIEYTEKSLKNGSATNTYMCHIKVNPSVPLQFSPAGTTFVLRFLNPGGGGIVNQISPHLLKDAFPVTLVYGKKKILSTAAGDFNAIKVNIEAADPFFRFVFSIASANNKNNDFGYFIENSGRRLLLKAVGYNTSQEIVEISNINIK